MNPIEEIAVELLWKNWQTWDNPNRHATILLRTLRRNEMDDLVRSIFENGITQAFHRVYRTADEMLPFQQHSQTWLETCLKMLPDALPDYPLHNYRVLEAIGRLDDLMPLFDDRPGKGRGKIIATHSVYKGRYLIFETRTGYSQARSSKAGGLSDFSTFYPDNADAASDGFVSFEGAMAHALCSRFGDAIYALIINR